MIERVLLGVMAACGAGKTTAAEFWAREFGIDGAAKYSDRPPRHDQCAQGGPGDAAYITSEEFDRRKALPDTLWYPYGQNRYLFSLEELHAQFKASPVLSMITGHRRVLERVALSLGHTGLVVPIYIRTDPEVIVHRLRKDGYTLEQIVQRTKHTTQSEDQYRADPGFFRHVIDNNHGRAAFKRELRDIATHYLSIVATVGV